MIRGLARLCELSLTPAQEARARTCLDELLAHFATLTEIDTTGVEPSVYPLPLAQRLRDDIATPALPRDEVLRNAPSVRAGAFVVPRVVGG